MIDIICRMSSERPSLSVIIPASRPEPLRRCLASLAAARLPQSFECLLVLNGSDEACAAAAQDWSGRVPGLRLIRGAPRSLGGARNAAVREASGDWLCFLDDDVLLPPGYFETLLRELRLHPRACVIGGPNLTPPGRPLFERCVGHVLGSRLCAGPMSRRTAGFAQDSWTDDSGLILCNLCIRRDALWEAGLRFDEDLVRNEENLLLARLLRGGRRAMHSPELFVFHERRGSLAAFCRQCFLSGQGRGAMTVSLPASLRAWHLAPLLLPLGLLGLGPWPSAAYAALAAGDAAFLAARHAEGWAAWGWLFVLHPAAHLSYAAGLLAGLGWGLVRLGSAGHAAACVGEAAPHAG